VVEAQWTSRHLNLNSFVSCQDEYSLLVREIERELLPAMAASDCFGVGWSALPISVNGTRPIT
jgi:aryl-alcohol dehydrogenase-like predicted oxidoreductase